MSQHLVERAGKQPAPDEVSAATDKVVHQNATPGYAMDVLERRHQLGIGEVMKKERAGDVVERVIQAGRRVEVGAYEP